MHSQHGHRAGTLSVGSSGVVRTEDAHGGFAGRGRAAALGVDVMAVSRWEWDVRAIPPYLPYAIKPIGYQAIITHALTPHECVRMPSQCGTKRRRSQGSAYRTC